MSSKPGMSAQSSSSVQPPVRKTTIMAPVTEPPDCCTVTHPKRFIRMFNIFLTLFYGQLIANAIYDNFIRGIPDLIEAPGAFTVIRVALGIVIFATSVMALVAIWLKLVCEQLLVLFLF